MDADSLRHLPPLSDSTRLVLSRLYGQSPMTGKELRERTGLPRRTVYTALQRLRELGVLQQKASLRDTRQTYFWVPAARPSVHTSLQSQPEPAHA